MITRRNAILPALIFIVAIAIGLALWHNNAAAQGQDWGGRRAEGRDSQPRIPMQGSFAVCASGDYVYVVSDSTLYQFSTADLKVVNKAQIEAEPSFRPDGKPGKMEELFPQSRKTPEDEGNR